MTPAHTPPTTTQAKRAQQGVSALFFGYGLLFATLGINTPLLRDGLGLSDGQLGLGLLAVSVGSFVTMPLTGHWAERWGSRALVRAGATLTFASLLLPFLAQSLPSFILAFTVLGLSNGILDVALSSQGITVEKAAGRPIMSRLHAFYSLGGLFGALIGGLLVGRVSPSSHAIIAIAAMLALAFWAAPRLLPDFKPETTAIDSQNPRRHISPVALMVGGLCFLGMFTEGANYDWVSVYYRDILQVEAGRVAWGYGAFTGAMTLGRLYGDRLRHHIGDERAVRGGAVLAAAGMALALLTPTLPFATLGYALSGLGLSNVVPVLFSAAGHALASRGIATVATVGYIGFLLGPPLIGFLSDAIGLPLALALAACSALAIAAAGGPVFAQLQYKKANPSE